MVGAQHNYMPMPGIEPITPRDYEARHLGRTTLRGGFMVFPEVMSQNEALRSAMYEQIIGQDAAVEAIVDAMDRQVIRAEDDPRPVACFGFLGPTGTGKSQTAKVLADYLGEGGGNLVKVDCSDFGHGHEVTRLTGAPPSYVGHDQTPFFSPEKVEQPGTVVLFDELEKGSDELYNLMLQIMEDGTLQLANGGVVNFRNAMIIATSNLGATEMSRELSESMTGFGLRERATDPEHLNSVATASFRHHFRPEFVNRFDKLVTFQPLDEAALTRVLDLKLNQANETYETRFGARVSLSEGTQQYLVTAALEERHNGARPLVRAFKSEIETPFGRHVSAGHVPEGTQVQVLHRDELPMRHPMRRPDRTLVFAGKSDTSIPRPSDIARRRAEEEAAAAHTKSVSKEIVFLGSAPTDPTNAPETD